MIANPAAPTDSLIFLAFRFSKNLQVSAKFNRNNLVVSDN